MDGGRDRAAKLTREVRESQIRLGAIRRRRDGRTVRGKGALRYQVFTDDWKPLSNAILIGASQRLQRRLNHLRDLDGELGQGLGEFFAFVVPMTALNELEAERCSREMILQVDVKCGGHEVVVSRRGGTETSVRVRP